MATAVSSTNGSLAQVHPSDAAAFCEQLQRTFTAAIAATSRQCFTLQVAGERIELTFAGPALEPGILPALQHLQVGDSGEPDLKICLWDSETTGVGMPPPPWKVEDYAIRGEVRGYNTGPYRATYNLDADILNLYDCRRRRAYFWIRDAGRLPQYEMASPLRSILHWGLASRSRQLVHAAAVGLEGRGVLLAGKSGSGKSSTALACLQHGFDYVGDDYCVVSTQPEATVHSLYTTAKLDTGSLAGFPLLADKVHSIARYGAQKALFFIDRHYPERVKTSMRLAALLVPELTGTASTALENTRRAAALARLAPSTIFQLPAAGPATFSTLSALVRGVPCHALNLGTDPREVAKAVARFLQTA